MNIGEYINRQIDNAAWGDGTINELADLIQKEHPDLKGFNRRGLYRMKQFYETYVHSKFVSSVMTQIQSSDYQSTEIMPSVISQSETRDIRGSIIAKLSWTHHLVLISRTKTDEKRKFYLRLCQQEKFSLRELEWQINSSAFERVIIGNETISSSLKEIHPDVANTFKDTYVFEFLNLPDQYSESDLLKGLLRQMKNFILELGRDFIFIG